MELNDNGETIAIPDKLEIPDDLLPKRSMNVSDLSPVKIRKYRYHDKFERK